MIIKVVQWSVIASFVVAFVGGGITLYIGIDLHDRFIGILGALFPYWTALTAVALAGPHLGTIAAGLGQKSGN